MSLIEIKGNLFYVPALTAYAHGVNCIGAMGAGIAVELRRRWPAMFAAYQAECKAGLRPGSCFAWAGGGVTIYNLATQPRPGPCATLAHVERAVAVMVAHAIRADVHRVGMPMIGCLRGGLRYRDVRPILDAAGQHIDIVVADIACHPRDKA